MKILLCTDGSRNGLSAVRLGGAIAAGLGAHVSLLCAVESERRNPERAFKRTNRAMLQSGATFTSVECKGRLVEQMLGQMLDVEYELVVVGYYARSFLEKMLWGSWATRIAHELPVSVLIVRDRRDTIERILIGISGGGFTTELSKWGGAIAAAFDARVTLLHVGQAPPLMYAGWQEVVETLTEFLQTNTPNAQALRQATTRLVEMQVRTDVELTHGLPERELLRVAQERDVDLLVVGSPWAVQSMQRALLHNVAEKVLLNTRRPVLVVRPRSK